MFGRLKKSIKSVLGKFSKQKEEELEEETPEEEQQQEPLPEPEVTKPEPKAEPAAIKEESKPVEKKAAPQKVEKKPEQKEPSIVKPRAAPKKVEEPKPEIKKPEPKAEPAKKPEPATEKPKPEIKKPEPKKESAPEPAKPAQDAKQPPTERPVPISEKPEQVEEKLEKPKPEVAEEAEKKGFLGKLFGRKEAAKADPIAEDPQPVKETPPVKAQEPEVVKPEPKVEKPEPKLEEEPKGFLEKMKASVSTKTITEKEFEELFDELEMALLENSVALEVVDQIRSDLQGEVVGARVKRGKLEELLERSLAKSIEGLFIESDRGLMERIVSLKDEKKPAIIAFVGINGCGKTTTIAKLAKQLQDRDVSCVLAASDTFRAAAIHQLEDHANRIGVKLIKHDYGSDPAAVAFDAVRHAEAKGIDVVLIDTSGRMHSKENLMQELQKIIRVAEPDLTVFVGEATTGNDAVEQAKSFDAAVGLDGIVLAKADVDEKGGAAISISFITGKPILALGTGQEYDDLVSFDTEKVMGFLGLA